MSGTTTPVTNINFSSASPAAPVGQQNILWNDDSSGDISGYLPNFVGDSGTGGTSGAVPAPAAGDAEAGMFLKADGTWEAPSGSGITSVAVAAPSSLFTVSGSPVTTSGTVALGLAVQAPNLVLAGPVGGTASAFPTFRTLTAADLPAGTGTGGGTTIALETDGTANAIQSKLNLVGGSNVTISSDTTGDVTISATVPNVVSFQTNSTANTDQGKLNLVAGANITLTSDSAGDVTIASTGSGSGGGTSIALQTNGTANTDQAVLNLVAGTGVTLTADSTGDVTIASTATSTGSAIALKTNGTVNTSQTTLNLANGANITLTADAVGDVTVALDPTVSVTTVNTTSVNASGTVSAAEVSTADAVISGGTINGTVIGGSTPAAGTFTTLAANTSVFSPVGNLTTVNSSTINTISVNASGAIGAASYSASGDITTSTMHTGTATVTGALNVAGVAAFGVATVNQSLSVAEAIPSTLCFDYTPSNNIAGILAVGPNSTTFPASLDIYLLNSAGNPSGNGPMVTITTSGMTVAGTISGTTKNFQIPYPGNPANLLIHSSLEGPEIGVYYRGTAQLANGTATVTLPAYFEALTLTTDRTVLLTPQFASTTDPISQLAASTVVNGQFTVRASDTNNPSQTFSWEVKAVRSDQPALQVVVPAPASTASTATT